MRLALTLVLALLLVPVVTAGTWLDRFEDGEIWSEWQVFEGTEKIDLSSSSLEEANGKLILPAQPGQTLTLSAGQFEGDFRVLFRFGLPPITAKGSVGVFLGKAPFAPGTPAVHASLVHSPDSPEFRAGVAGGPESSTPYMALSSFTIMLWRTGGQVTAFIGEDDDQILSQIQLAEPFSLPEGPVDAFVSLSADAGSEGWKIQIEEASIEGDSVADKRPAASEQPGTESGEGRPFEVNEASRRANNGFRMLQLRRFDEALAEYAIAAQLSRRFVEIHNTLRDHIIPIARSEGGIEAVRDVPMGVKGVTVGEWLHW